ncbi:MAG: NAD(P)-binding domain-containing protein [Gammaproteobacteria bacterium]
MEVDLLEKETDVLIIGAGPFGLAMAAHCRHLGIDHRIVGRPMEFWQANMPKGLYLRSACGWHLDTRNVDTIDRFLQTQGLTAADVEPLSLRFYLAYARWFQEQKQIETIPRYVRQLDHVDSGKNPFRAAMDDGRIIAASNVVIAAGFKYFKQAPQALVERLPAGRFSHTCDLVDFTEFKGKRCLIIGGRQSAFEWAALLNEAGAAAVHVSHRHGSPAFSESDWSWVDPIVDAIVDNPGWYRNLSTEEKEAVNHRFWAEGRLKVEPWLESRVMKETVKLWPNTQVIACDGLPGGDMAIRLDSGEKLTVDHVILATGYKVDMDRLPFLAQGNISSKLTTRGGYPVLNEHLQTNIPGLFVTSMAAVQDFGPFFAFTVSVRASANLIGQAVVNKKRT